MSSAVSGRAVDIPGNTSVDNTQLALHDQSAWNDAQRWNFEPTGVRRYVNFWAREFDRYVWLRLDGYQLVNYRSDGSRNCMDVSGGGTPYDGQKVVQYDCNPNGRLQDNQLWFIVVMRDGTRIFSGMGVSDSDPGKNFELTSYGLTGSNGAQITINRSKVDSSGKDTYEARKTQRWNVPKVPYHATAVESVPNNSSIDRSYACRSDWKPERHSDGTIRWTAVQQPALTYISVVSSGEPVADSDAGMASLIDRSSWGESPEPNLFDTIPTEYTNNRWENVTMKMGYYCVPM
ncbi:MAG: RICIN domain-containing protein [Actinomycetota bacterium]|nr:RICIN domain-containing protein [Actinomycetota bacterium]